jgi:hypothetical protein
MKGRWMPEVHSKPTCYDEGSQTIDQRSADGLNELTCQRRPVHAKLI